MGLLMRILISLSLFLLLNQVYAQDVPPFANITGIEYRGTGCDAESARASITPDLSYISILYDRFTVEIGQGTANPMMNQDIKNCAVIIRMDVPAGWSFQFDSVEYRGFVSLPNQNTVAMQMISAFTSDGRRGRNFQQNVMRGPMTDNFVTTYQAPVIGMNGAEGLPLRGIIGGVIGGLIRGGPRMQPMPPPPMMGPGGGRFGPGPGGIGPGGPARMRFRPSRGGDLNECSDSTQQAVMMIRSNIMVRNLGDRSNPTVKMMVDSTDSAVQKLKLNWNKCVPAN
jgi:hypothetical protein